MTVAYYIVIVLHVIACLFLIGVVLLQQGKNQDLANAFGGGSGTQAAFGPRGSANVLSKATTILAGVFMVTCLALSMLRPNSSSVLDQAGAGAPAPVASPVVPGASAPPAAAPAASVPAAPAAAPTASPAQ
ncbi:MAG: preprotein translocase subunit SecG [Vicinamibacteria bacterium]